MATRFGLGWPRPYGHGGSRRGQGRVLKKRPNPFHLARGLTDPHLHVSYRKVKAQVEVEGREYAGSD